MYSPIKILGKPKYLAERAPDLKEFNDEVLSLRKSLDSSIKLQEETTKKYTEAKEDLLKCKRLLVAKLKELKKKQQDVDQLKKLLDQLEDSNKKLRNDNVELTRLSNL
eukprot:TRINITY_DN2879_c0_g3_i1.p2 TRINITY_DN2879_c0_g3~~TRINITY_DN2879_c0_g3_i1.p2  ORF type:complete len:108 (+),score=8.84 TRINITY_DN2879_c0_g3_i1:378-701(+)